MVCAASLVVCRSHWPPGDKYLQIMYHLLAECGRLVHPTAAGGGAVELWWRKQVPLALCTPQLVDSGQMRHR